MAVSKRGLEVICGMAQQRLIIHLGPPKTGSTTIQSFMRAASEAGSLRNIHYPLIDKKVSVNSMESGNGSQISHYLRHEGGADKPIAELEKKVLQVLGNSQDSRQPVLLSAEGLWDLESTSARILVDILTEIGFAPELLLVVRPFQDVWQSHISQAIRGGEFENFGSAIGAIKYIESIKTWSGFGFPIHTIPYDSENVTHAILDFIGETNLKSYSFGINRINTKLTGPEARIIRKSYDLSSDKKLCKQIAALIPSLYSALSLNLRDHLESRMKIHCENTLRIPDVWQPVHGYKKLEEARILHQTSLNENIWSLLMLGADEPKTYSFNDTPALAAIDNQVSLTELEYGVLSEALISALSMVHVHVSNLEALMASGFLQTELTLANDGKLEFNDSSQLVRSRLGFDPIHYLILNPDVDRAGVEPYEHFKLFGKSEGRYTKIRQRSESNSLLLNEKPLFLVHSPRTGGTALREMLTDEVGEELVTRSHRDVAIEKNETYSDFEFLLEESGIDAASKNAVIVGHFPAKVKDILKFDHYSAIFVREPIARSISMLRKESKVQGLSIEELINDTCFMNKYIKDAQSRILTAPASLEAGSGIFDVNESILELAKSKLREFDFIGLYENYEESIRHFDSTFKTSLLFRMNTVNESPDVDVPTGIAEVLAPLVAMDLKLYEYAVELFQARTINSEILSG